MHLFPAPLRRATWRAVSVPAFGLLAIVAIPACQPIQPAANETLGESVLQLGDAVSALQQENAMLQEQLDSLRIAVARQDTSLRRFANLAGMPLP